MKAKARFKSEAFEAKHSSASAMRRIGAISEATMREFEESTLAARENTSANEAATPEPVAEPPAYTRIGIST